MKKPIWKGYTLNDSTYRMFWKWQNDRDSFDECFIFLNFLSKETYFCLDLMTSRALLICLWMGNSAHLPCGSWNISRGIAEGLPVEQPARMLGPYKDRRESQRQKYASGGMEQMRFQSQAWNLQWLSSLLANRKGRRRGDNGQGGSSLFCHLPYLCLLFQRMTLIGNDRSLLC